MPNAEECRWETRQEEERQRDRVRRRRRRCREYPWWDPRGWVCWTVTFFEDVWVTVVITIREWVCVVHEVTEEVTRYVGIIIDWILGVLDHLVGVFITGNDTGYWPIVLSEQRDVPSRPTLNAFTRSFALATDLDSVSLQAPYREEGVHVEVRLVEGSVEWKIADGEFVPFQPRESDYPPLPGVDPVLAPRAVSYHGNRLGNWNRPPAFDMIAAGGDRFIAKATGSDRIFIAILGNLFIHPLADGSRVQLPQSFFKLDPDCGVPNTDRDELLAPLTVPGDDERHAATERFPLFRVLFGNETLYTDMMVAWFAPRIWVKLDTRPRKGSSAPPDRYPQYDHITYRSNLPDWRFSRLRTRRSIRYRRVMDLGVGVSHFHEAHDCRFGGEADSLSGKGATFGHALAGFRRAIFQGVEFEAAYRYANGPLEDYGGWVDGTCIYYMLVQLKSDAAIDATGNQEAFAVLWTDEQLVFTERWRVLDIFDRDFMSPFQPIVGDISRNEDEFYWGAPFDGDRYFCPFRYGHVRRHSRMAVARQFIAVTGLDPATGEDEIYTTHFAWATMDKTWRRRLPPPVEILRDPTIKTDDDFADVSDFSMRGDSTMMIRGERRVDGKPLPGYWTQRVLPASGQEIPSVENLADEDPFAPRSARYSHPWRFTGHDAFTILHQRYSHFGVLEPVDSRIQMYRISEGQIVFAPTISPAEAEATLWEDQFGLLKITHRRLNYARAAQALQGLLDMDPEELVTEISRAQEDRTHPSQFNNPVRFRLAHRPGLGWILMYADKRDDKLIGLDPLPNNGVVLVANSNSARTVNINDLRHVKNARDRHGTSINREPDGVSPPAVSTSSVEVLMDQDLVQEVRISFTLARGPADERVDALDYREWVATNVWRVKLGGVIPETSTVEILLDRERETDFQASAGSQTWNFTWFPTSAEQRNGALARMLSESGAARFGTSLWFVGATGLAAPPDGIDWL